MSPCVSYKANDNQKLEGIAFLYFIRTIVSYGNKANIPTQEKETPAQARLP